MSELDVLINSPLGALFFVSGAISVFILLTIFVLKKGTEIHSLLGYIYFFGLCFANYAAAMAFYQGLLPLPAIAFTIPTSTLFIILGLASIIPKQKSTIRIKIHVVSMVCSTICVLLGTLINWYHFNITILDVFRWSDLTSILIMSAPIFALSILLMKQFLTNVESYIIKKQDLQLKKADIEELEIAVGERNQILYLQHEAENKNDASRPGT